MCACTRMLSSMRNFQIGHRVTIHAGTVIGSDGYGYVLNEGRHRKMLQVGNVIIHDDVECLQRRHRPRCARLHRHRTGTKIDNLVHIAHNVAVGQNLHHHGTGRLRRQHAFGRLLRGGLPGQQ